MLSVLKTSLLLAAFVFPGLLTSNLSNEFA